MVGTVISNAALAQCPTDGTTTYTLNVQDELATTATNLDAEYFFFNGNKLIKEGTTGSDGTVNVDVACGKDYNLLLINTTAGSGSYGKVIELKARSSDDTVNAELVPLASPTFEPGPPNDGCLECRWRFCPGGRGACRHGAGSRDRAQRGHPGLRERQGTGQRVRRQIMPEGVPGDVATGECHGRIPSGRIPVVDSRQHLRHVRLIELNRRIAADHIA